MEGIFLFVALGGRFPITPGWTRIRTMNVTHCRLQAGAPRGRFMDSYILVSGSVWVQGQTEGDFTATLREVSKIELVARSVEAIQSRLQI